MSSAKVKNEWSYTFTPPYTFMASQTAVPFTGHIQLYSLKILEFVFL